MWNSPLLPTSTAEPRTQGQMEAPKPPCPPGHSPMLAMPTSGRQRSHPSPVPAAPPRAALQLRGARPGHTAGLGGRSERKVLTPAGPSGQRTNYRVPAVLTVARSGDTSSQEPRSRPTGALGLGAGHGREGRAGPSGAGRGGAPSSTLSPGGVLRRRPPGPGRFPFCGSSSSGQGLTLHWPSTRPQPW